MNEKLDCTECMAFHYGANMSCPCDGDENKCPFANELENNNIE